MASLPLDLCDFRETRGPGAGSSTLQTGAEHCSEAALNVVSSNNGLIFLPGTKDTSVDTDDEYAGFNEIEDEMDEYVFDPQELLENDLLDKDLDQPSNSQKKGD
ncbi:hypothetical protein NDU88_004500 [Pleurodeles waltl]|uniref:Uncharacterized protein n=1 Tax=Pleurodeles waltl TaxID=8319 RepID=A0AAV7M8D7_PLEWA|nr:hypothetical protein NDU88_004500 [Pleurodeles waltl]